MDKPKSTPVRRRTVRASAQGAPASNVLQFSKPKLVPAAMCHETADLLVDLCQEVARGELIGIAVITIYKNKRYGLDITGEARRNPTFTLGAVTMLQTEIAKKIEDSNS